MKKNSRKHLQEVLDKNSSCYVLISCGQPSAEGEMQVEMTYQGDVTLAAYLIHSAQMYIEQEEAREEAHENYSLSSIRLVE